MLLEDFYDLTKGQKIRFIPLDIVLTIKGFYTIDAFDNLFVSCDGINTFHHVDGAKIDIEADENRTCGVLVELTPGTEKLMSAELHGYRYGMCHYHDIELYKSISPLMRQHYVNLINKHRSTIFQKKLDDRDWTLEDLEIECKRLGLK